MPTPVSTNTQFSDIYGDFASSKKDDRHIRGGTKNGGKALYVHDKISLGFTAKRRHDREAKRSAGAVEIRNALVNQYGAKVADAVLKNVADTTGKDLSAGITVGDLKKIKAEIANQAKPDPKGKASHDALMTTAKHVSSLLFSWATDAQHHDDNPNLAHKRDDSPLGQAGTSYAALPKPAREFVGRRLTDLARDEAKTTGRPVSDERLAKLTSKLVKQAKSPHFAELDKLWKNADRTAGKLMGSVRGGGRRDIGPLVKRSSDYVESILPLGDQENKAAGRDDEIMDAIGGDDLLNYGEQGVDGRLGGQSIAESNAIYHKAMGAKGASRAVLFAATLSELSIPQHGDNRQYHTANSNIVTGTQAAVRSFGTKGQVANVNDEFAAIANALDDAIEEYTKQQGKTGKDARVFSQDVRERLSSQGPFVDNDESEIILDKAMRKAGIGDKSLVGKAYGEIMSATGLDRVEQRAIDDGASKDRSDSIDSNVSVASLVKESNMKR